MKSRSRLEILTRSRSRSQRLRSRLHHCCLWCKPSAVVLSHALLIEHAKFVSVNLLLLQHLGSSVEFALPNFPGDDVIDDVIDKIDGERRSHTKFGDDVTATS